MFGAAAASNCAFNRRLTRKLTVSGRHDGMQLGAGQNALTESNILGSLLSRRLRLSMVNRGEIGYEHNGATAPAISSAPASRRSSATATCRWCVPTAGS